MSVARAEERDHPHEPDEELVAREAGGALRQRCHLGLEALPRDAPERRRMDLLDRGAELADVVGEGDRSGRTGLRRRDDRDHGEWHEEQARHPHCV